jgi:hypothetical protein
MSPLLLPRCIPVRQKIAQHLWATVTPLGGHVRCDLRRHSCVAVLSKAPFQGSIKQLTLVSQDWTVWRRLQLPVGEGVNRLELSPPLALSELEAVAAIEMLYCAWSDGAEGGLSSSTLEWVPP